MGYYNYFDNPPDPARAEVAERMRQVLSWLLRHGVPKSPLLTSQVRQLPPELGGRVYTTWDWVFRHPEKDPFPHDLGLALNAPAVLLVQLKEYYGFGDPRVWEPYPDPELKPDEVVVVVKNPLGAERAPGEYSPARGDRLPVGAAVTVDGVRYRKERRYWAFVPYAVWVRDDTAGADLRHS